MPREPELEGGVDFPKGIMAFYQLRMEERREVLRKAGSLTLYLGFLGIFCQRPSTFFSHDMAAAGGDLGMGSW